MKRLVNAGVTDPGPWHINPGEIAGQGRLGSLDLVVASK